MITLTFLVLGVDVRLPDILKFFVVPRAIRVYIPASHRT
jgi:hypothetical protein